MTDFPARYLSDYRQSDFTISTIDLTFELSDTATLVTNVMQVKRIGDNNVSLKLDGEQLTLVSIKLQGNELSSKNYDLTETYLEVFTDENEFTLTIVTEINPQTNTSLEGLFKSGAVYCTQCEAEGFRRITYYLDRPDVMAVFTTKIIADKQHPFLLSNGNKIAEGDLENNKHFVQWHDPFPKPCYLFALVAGDFDVLSDSYTTSENNEVTLDIFVDKGNLSKANHAMDSLKRSMKWDEETFGLVYDLDIYMIVAVDFFNMGAMENKGLNVFNSKFVLADEKTATDTDYFNVEAVIAHEYFHNWTGNRITCRDWFQLSLKEGLTVFRDQQFSADMHSAAVTRIQNVRLLRSHQFAEDNGPMAHPIRPEKVIEMNNFYTLTVYEKGAEVIRMIHTLLGVEGFRKGMDLYFQRYDGMAVTCDNFVNAMADASGVDLTLFQRWYSQSGTPLLKVNESFDDQSGEYKLTISQHHKNVDKQLPKKDLHIPIQIELIDNHNEQEISNQSHLLELTSSEQSWTYNQLNKKPIIAFLGGFSAPVKVDFTQSENDIATVMLHAKDEFCRWDAGQKLLTLYIKELLSDKDFELPNSLLLSFEKIITSNNDLAFIAEQLTLPSFDELVDSVDEVDPIALISAIEEIKYFIANGLKSQLKQRYIECVPLANQDDTLAIQKRSLKNICLSYLCLLPETTLLVKQQYQTSNNMTDTLAALTCSAKNNLSCFPEHIIDFEHQWQDTALVMDKWFMINAILSSDDIFQKLEALLSHRLFSIKNPNRARSLIGAFSTSNPKYFHCISGRGYQFLAKQVALLNNINPQVASRLITPLIQFKSFDKKRQVLMKDELLKLSTLDCLSKDLKEKLDAALS